MASIDMLFESFNFYLNTAKENYKKENYYLAKVYFQKAAEQMLIIAKDSPGDLKTSRYNRAKNLIEIADSIKANKKVTVGNNSNSEEVDSGIVQKPQKVTLEEALNTLENLTGLENVKKQVKKWVAEREAFKLRISNGLSVPKMTNHLVFMGNAGSGKTTVARIIAQICHALGLVTDGQLVEVAKEDLCAGYVGQTAIKTKEVVKKAIGGVLFIDEAYRLSDTNANDFGKEAIETILKMMEDNRNNLIVIVAGYEKEMKKFIDSNTGLYSRFKNFIEFDDYTSDQLYEIFLRMCIKESYNISDDLKKILPLYFKYLYDTRTAKSGNGRAVRNFFEEIVSAQSIRVSKNPLISKDDLMLFTYQDFIEATHFDINSIDNNNNNNSNNNSNTTKNSNNDNNIDDNINNNDKKKNTVNDDISNSNFYDDLSKYLDKEKSNPALEPRSLGEFIGQKHIVKALLKEIAIAKKEGRRHLDNILLFGNPGLGKSTLMRLIAKELGVKFEILDCSQLGSGKKSLSSFQNFFMRIAKANEPVVIALDEVHMLSKELQSSLLTLLNDRVYISPLDANGNHNVYRINEFTFIAATTDDDKVLDTIKNRCLRLKFQMVDYSFDDLTQIYKNKFEKLGIKVTDDAIEACVRRSRGAMRYVNSIVEGLKNALYNDQGEKESDIVDKDLALKYFKEQGIDSIGLEKKDIEILKIIESSSNNAISVSALAARVGLDTKKYLSEYEKYLIKIGFINVTGKGRSLTEKAREYLKNENFDNN